MKDKKLEKKFIDVQKKDGKVYSYYKRAIRNIDVMNDFDDEQAKRFINFVTDMSTETQMSLNENEDSDITVYINSKGGVVTSLLAMIDTMNLLPNDFKTVCIGQCASCGAVLLSCGTKGKRFITENARVLIHQVSSGMWGKNSEIQADAKETDRMNKLLLSILAKNCGKTVEELEQLTLGGDLVLDAQQAVDFGIVDAILTKEVLEQINNGSYVYLTDEEDEETPPETIVTKEELSETKSKKDYSTTPMNLEVKSIKEDKKCYFISGIASTPDVDRVNDIVEPEALIDSVNRIGMPAFCHQHNLDAKPLGVCERITQENGNTIVDLKMPKNEETEQIKDLIDIGAYKGLSIGYIPTQAVRNEKGNRVIKSLDWYEISLVTVPANPNAKVLQTKKMQKNKSCDIMNEIKTIRDVENLLVNNGCTKKEAGYIISLIKSSSSQGEPSEGKGEGEPSQEQENLKALLEIRDLLKK